tara:strand:+ start:272 stop:697 length:426 start_codon:yes stop_codon:yes gene_type:complete
MSVLELNGRVFDASTTGTLTLTGEGSATTNVTQGLAKVWGHFTMASTTARDSFNISSLTDDKTGIFTVDYSSNMGNVNYSPSTGGTHRDGVSEHGWVLAVQNAGTGADDMATNELSLSGHAGNSALADSIQATFQVCGDLA